MSERPSKLWNDVLQRKRNEQNAGDRRLRKLLAPNPSLVVMTE
jgi:hypothetical protein